MAKFHFFQDVLQSIWLRKNFTVEATDLDSAKEVAKKYRNKELFELDKFKDVELHNEDYLYGTADSLPVPEEDDFSIEILDSKKDVVADNRPIRVFGKYERVFCSTDFSDCHSVDIEASSYGFVKQKTVIHNPDDKVTVIMDNGLEFTLDQADVYRYPIHPSKLAKCPHCGKPLFAEHHKDIDYPYYCPECDENFYGFEVLNF